MSEKAIRNSLYRLGYKVRKYRYGYYVIDYRTNCIMHDCATWQEVIDFLSWAIA